MKLFVLVSVIIVSCLAQNDFYLVTTYSTGDCSGEPEPYYAAYKSGACLKYNTTVYSLICESPTQLVEAVFAATDQTCSNPLAKVPVPLGCNQIEKNQSVASTCSNIAPKNLVVFSVTYFSQQECKTPDSVPEFFSFIPEGACFATGSFSTSYSCNPVTITTYSDGVCGNAIFTSPLDSTLCSPSSDGTFLSSSYCISL